jgi:hypothetical protein
MEEFKLTDQGVVEVTETMTSEEEKEAPVTSEESLTTEVEDGGEAETKVESRPTYYTDEEAAKIIEEGGVLDSNRLSPTQKLVQKSFERGTTRAFQEAAELKNQYEQAMRQLKEREQEQSDPKEKLYRQYKSDPVKFVQEINQAIENLEMVDPAADDYRSARQQIAKLSGLKNEFDARQYQETSYQNSLYAVVNQANQEIVDAIPNFSQVKENLRNFSFNQLGLTQYDVEMFTDPIQLAQRGFDPKSAVRLTKAVHKVFQMLNAGKTAEAKVDKTPPIAVSSGSPSTPKSDTVTYQKAFDKALKTGDWTEVYKIKGVL